jgi:putative peptidoglycan lipid II flippase
MSFLSRTSLLLAVFFGLGKIIALFGQVIIARQFGLSAELDSFNVANNLPDMLFALISGGALAMAFIPVLSEVLTQEGRRQAWDLFSRIANLAFIVTAVIAIIVAVLAGPLVRWEIGIAPGFEYSQQKLVVSLMRLNLIATLIFSISGLVMAGLQANQHFLLPAMAPLLYNVGQIFGAVVLSPEQGYTVAGITLPAYGLGVYGLVYGVIIGALLHLGIQVPGLIKYRFHWVPRIGIHNPAVQKVLRLLIPRLGTMMLIQLIFIIRDNLASRLAEGSVTALTYGWMVQQVPER